MLKKKENIKRMPFFKSYESYQKKLNKILNHYMIESILEARSSTTSQAQEAES